MLYLLFYGRLCKTTKNEPTAIDLETSRVFRVCGEQVHEYVGKEWVVVPEAEYVMFQGQDYHE